MAAEFAFVPVLAALFFNTGNDGVDEHHGETLFVGLGSIEEAFGG